MIRSTVEKIGPELAEKILSSSQDKVKNRNVTDGHVEWLASQMKAGKWRTNGEPIILDEEGHLLDGQHRLWAIATSGVEIETVVTRGVDRNTFATIDTGAARTGANVFQMSGEVNCHVLAAALGWLYRFENGKMLWGIKSSGYTAATGISLLKKNPEVRDAVAWSLRMQKNIFLRELPKSALAFLRYIFCRHKPNKAEEFFELVGDVRPDSPGTATRAFRDWILKNKNSRQPANTLEFIAISVKAWGAFLDGETPKTYVWRRAGAFPESFPTFPGERESRGKAIRGMVNKEEAAKKKKAQ